MRGGREGGGLRRRLPVEVGHGGRSEAEGGVLSAEKGRGRGREDAWKVTMEEVQSPDASAGHGG